MKFLLASLKTNFCSGFPFLSLVNFSSVHSWPAFKTISESQAGFRTTFKGTGGYQKAGTSSLKKVTGRNFTIMKWFHRSKQKFHFVFPLKKLKKTTENCEYHKRPFKKSTLSRILGPSEKIFISWHYSFKSRLLRRHEPAAADFARAGERAREQDVHRRGEPRRAVQRGRVWKNPGLKKKPAQWVFWVFWFFFVCFFVFCVFFYIFAQKREFLGFFSFKNTLRCIQTLL